MTGYTLTWHLDATPDRVFRAWTEPELLGWFFNPAEPTPDEPIEVDLRVGGRWRQRMRVNDELSYDTGGVYREIVPSERLVFAWGAPGGWPDLDPDDLDAGPRVEIDLAADRDGTLMTLTVAFPAGFVPHPYERTGWLETVERLIAQVGGSTVPTT